MLRNGSLTSIWMPFGMIKDVSPIMSGTGQEVGLV